MRLKVIACNVLSREIYHYAAQSPHVIDVELMDRGLHDEPDRLRSALQEAVTRSDDERYDAIALAYALCSNGTASLAARQTPLVVPKAHDCITLLLGSRERYSVSFRSNPGTYYYTPGWVERAGVDKERVTIDGREAREKIFQQYVEKYGEENARYLMEVLHGWHKNYNRAVFICTPVAELRPLEELAQAKVKGVAADHGWNYEETEGDVRLLRKLVFGEWGPDEFLIVPPGKRTQPSYDEQVICYEG